MNEKERKKIIQESRKFGSISLRHQILRVHKNGAKFPISKSYVDDELLDPEVSYTLILIPEAKIAAKTNVALTFFKRRSGPHLFYSYPEDALNNIEKENLEEIMTLSFKERFFHHQSSAISSINYYFEIHSEWARGNKEMLMISVMLNQKISQAIEEVIKSLCIDFESQISSTQNMFKALYINELESFSDEEQTDIIKFSEQLRAVLQEFYKKIKILQRRKNAKYILTVSMEIEKKLDLNQIAQKIEGAEFNAEKFPGLVMKSGDPSVTIILFSTGKMVITGLKSSTEAEQVVDKAINKIRDIGAKITSRKIAIESVK
ncbi:MAG: hypothetical protein ACFE8G_08215 [Candidatus Hermodarchaeota archaeon]